MRFCLSGSRSPPSVLQLDCFYISLGRTQLTQALPTGRGGAGNIGESDPSKQENEDIKTIPTIKSPVYTTGMSPLPHPSLHSLSLYPIFHPSTSVPIQPHHPFQSQTNISSSSYRSRRSRQHGPQRSRAPGIRTTSARHRHQPTSSLRRHPRRPWRCRKCLRSDYRGRDHQGGSKGEEEGEEVKKGAIVETKGVDYRGWADKGKDLLFGRKKKSVA
jgi:hypothetical protein